MTKRYMLTRRPGQNGSGVYTWHLISTLIQHLVVSNWRNSNIVQAPILSSTIIGGVRLIGPGGGYVAKNE